MITGNRINRNLLFWRHYFLLRKMWQFLINQDSNVSFQYVLSYPMYIIDFVAIVYHMYSRIEKLSSRIPIVYLDIVPFWSMIDLKLRHITSNRQYIIRCCHTTVIYVQYRTRQIVWKCFYAIDRLTGVMYKMVKNVI
jgi:hypothetical protein